MTKSSAPFHWFEYVNIVEDDIHIVDHVVVLPLICGGNRPVDFVIRGHNIIIDRLIIIVDTVVIPKVIITGSCLIKQFIIQGNVIDVVARHYTGSALFDRWTYLPMSDAIPGIDGRFYFPRTTSNIDVVSDFVYFPIYTL